MTDIRVAVSTFHEGRLRDEAADSEHPAARPGGPRHQERVARRGAVGEGPQEAGRRAAAKPSESAGDPGSSPALGKQRSRDQSIYVTSPQCLRSPALTFARLPSWRKSQHEHD